MTKALMEKLGATFARKHPDGPVVSTVRYGNVLMSRGSVVPLFVEQLNRGESMTVTDPQMTRFLKRDLNYAQYFDEGELRVAPLEDVTSHNCQRLDASATAALLRATKEFASL